MDSDGGALTGMFLLGGRFVGEEGVLELGHDVVV